MDYGEGAPTRVPGTDAVPQTPPVRGDAALLAAQLPARGLEVQPADLGAAARAGLALLRWLLPVRGAGQPQGRRPQTRPLRARAQPGVCRHAGALRRGGRPGTGTRPQPQGHRGERHRPHPGHRAQGPALRDHRGAERVPGALGEASWAAPRIHGTEPPPGAGHVRGGAAPPAGAARDRHAVLHRVQRTVCDDSCVRVDHSSYAARPARIGTKVLVRIFERHIEIRDLATRCCCAPTPTSSAPAPSCCPTPSGCSIPRARPAAILVRPARSAAAQRGCASCCLPSRAGSASASSGASSVWPTATPRRCVDAACERALEDGVYSYKHVKAIAQSLLEHALATHATRLRAQATDSLTQQHPLIRDTADLRRSLRARRARPRRTHPQRTGAPP